MSADVSFLVSQAASTSSAMTSILQTSMQIAANASTSDRASTIAHTQTLLSSLVRCAVDNVNPAVLPPASAAEAALEVHKAFVKYVSSDSDALDALLVASALVDAMWLVDTELFDEEDEVSATVAASRARLVAFGRRIVNLKFVPEVLLKERLDFDFLESITVIPSAREANKKYIRLNTSILYKQQKFNLLREESEGFAMLETYLASNLPASLDVFWQSHHHGPSGELLSHAQVAELHRAHVHAKARAVLENITSLIGFFDLNPNKVVDVLLDVFVANVCDNWDFFVALLEVSHWQSKRSFKHVEGKLEPVEVKEPSPVLGQILGFKFDYYNSVASTHVTPPQLLWVTAILLKHKLVALEDVFPHLYPTTDEDMDAEYTAFRNKLAVARKEAGKYKDNALADAGALGGDGGDGGYQVKERGGSENTAAQPPAPGTSTTTIAPPATPTPKASKTNQKGVLASYLLAIGAISLARQIMDRHPTLIHMHPDIGDYMCRLLHVVIEPVYANLRPARGREHPTVPATQSPPMNTLNHKLAQQMERARVGRRGVLHYPKLSFFYEGWREGLPACTDYDAVVRVLRVLLSFVSVSLDVVLVSKLCRIGKAHLQTSKDEKVQNAWLSIISKFLFPALSMTDQNPALSNDVWSLVKTFPYDRRYALYGEWKHKTYTSIPALSVARAGCISDAKYTMRRLSKETVKRFGRYVGKIAHSNPVVAFHYILELLQMYENQNSCVVEGSKYMSEMSFDVVAFTLIEQLCDPKGRVQEGGIGVKLWLKSLSFFAGALFKKHAIELGGVVRFLYARLAQGQTVDLLLLQEIVAQMCGIKAITDDVTSDQFAALAGGETLRREAFGNDPVRVVKKSSQRLLRAVVETDLVMGFAVLMGQHVSSNVHADSVNLVTEIKVLGWQMDNIRATFTQYLDFIVTNMDREAFAAVVPSIEILRVEYGLTPDIAFAILRPKLNTLCQTRPALAPADAMDVDGEIENPRYHLALEDTVQGVTKTLHEIIWKTLSPHFYVSFWQLSLNDIAFPKARYQSEIAKLRATIESLLREKGSVGGNTPAKRKKDRERHTMTIQLLEKEMQVHSAAHEKTMERLKEESLHWFQPDDTIEDIRAYRFELVDLIIQHCLIPRCLFSPADAIFSAKFINLAHSLGTPNLMTVPIFDRILDRNNLQSMIYLCSEMEARNYGRFLCEMLTTLTQWFTNQSLYLRDCIGDGLPGFALRWNPPPEGEEAVNKFPVADLMKHEEFFKVMYKWHTKMHKAFTLCLESGEYAQITNAVIVLDKIKDHFPMMKEHAIQLDESCRKVIEKETDRKDLKLMCTAYSGRLQLMAKTLMTKSAFQNGGIDPDPPTQRDTSAVSSGDRMGRSGSDANLSMRGDRDRDRDRRGGERDYREPGREGVREGGRDGGSRDGGRDTIRMDRETARDNPRDLGRDAGRDAGRGERDVAGRAAGERVAVEVRERGAVEVRERERPRHDRDRLDQRAPLKPADRDESNRSVGSSERVAAKIVEKSPASDARRVEPAIPIIMPPPAVPRDSPRRQAGRVEPSPVRPREDERTPSRQREEEARDVKVAEKVTESTKRDEGTRASDPRGNDTRREDVKRDEGKREPVKRDETKRDDARRDDKREDIRRPANERDESATRVVERADVRRGEGSRRIEQDDGRREERRDDRRRGNDRSDSHSRVPQRLENRVDSAPSRADSTTGASITVVESPRRAAPTTVVAPLPSRGDSLTPPQKPSNVEKDKPNTVKEKTTSSVAVDPADKLRLLREKLNRSKQASQSSNELTAPGLLPSTSAPRKDGPAPPPPPPPPLPVGLAPPPEVKPVQERPIEPRRGMVVPPVLAEPPRVAPPKLSIMERLGRKEVPPSSVVESGAGTLRDREGERQKDRVSDGGENKSDGKERKDRKHRERDDVDDKRKREREQSNLDREPKRPKVDEADVPSSSVGKADRKRPAEDTPGSEARLTSESVQAERRRAPDEGLVVVVEPRAVSEPRGIVRSETLESLASEGVSADGSKRVKINRTSLDGRAGSASEVGVPASTSSAVVERGRGNADNRVGNGAVGEGRGGNFRDGNGGGGNFRDGNGGGDRRYGGGGGNNRGHRGDHRQRDDRDRRQDGNRNEGGQGGNGGNRERGDRRYR